MRIAIVNITGGGMSGGYRKYLPNIVSGLASHPDVDALLCASPASLEVRDWIEPLPNVAFIDCDAYSLRHMLFYGVDQRLKSHLERFSPDVIFIPADRYFRFNNTPVVNMIRNMESFIGGIDGDIIIERLKKRIQYIDTKRAVQKAHGVIAVSKFVRDSLIDGWNIDNGKISLVYHGTKVPAQDRDNCTPRLIPENWRGKFLFTTGSIRPARGLEDALWAMRYLSLQNRHDIVLVIAGETAPGMAPYRNKLIDWIQKYNLASKTCWAGKLNEREMAWCYKNCKAFLMTSRVEACPNIVLEAMSYGCIPISADNPPMPEFFGDTAVYYPPRDGKSLSEAIQRMLNWDDEKRNGISEKAKKRAAEFSWDTTVERTLSALKKAIEVFRLNRGL